MINQLSNRNLVLVAAHVSFVDSLTCAAGTIVGNGLKTGFGVTTVIITDEGNVEKCLLCRLGITVLSTGVTDDHTFSFLSFISTGVKDL